MKRKTDLVEEEHGSKNEGNESSGDESKDEEPRIKDVLSNLSQTVLEKRASELLHSMAVFKDISKAIASKIARSKTARFYLNR